MLAFFQALQVSRSNEQYFWQHIVCFKLGSTDFGLLVAQACKYVTLIQPSSAAAERDFSLLANSLSQESALEDYIEASLMLQYNSH